MWQSISLRSNQWRSWVASSVLLLSITSQPFLFAWVSNKLDSVSTEKENQSLSLTLHSAIKSHEKSSAKENNLKPHKPQSSFRSSKQSSRPILSLHDQDQDENQGLRPESQGQNQDQEQNQDKNQDQDQDQDQEHDQGQEQDEDKDQDQDQDQDKDQRLSKDQGYGQAQVQG